MDGLSALPDIRHAGDSTWNPGYTALNYWAGGNKGYVFRGPNCLSQLRLEEFEKDGVGGYNYVQMYGIRKSTAGWGGLQKVPSEEV